LPGRRDDFRRALGTAIEYARAVGCPNLHLMAGNAPRQGRELAYATYADNLAQAAESLADAGLTGLIEPLCALEAPGYFLDSLPLALRALDDVAHPKLRLQFDLYHAHVMGLDLGDCVRRHANRIGHIQLADAPGRHEPGTGVIPVETVLQQIDDAGYPGWIGLEYRPLVDTSSSLAWAKRHLAAAPASP
jgi:hydroxypyruvate isomerase